MKMFEYFYLFDELRKEHAIKFENDEEVETELVIVRGLPGSGKSSYAKERFPDHLQYEPDHWFSDVKGNYRFDLQMWDLACESVYTLTDHALSRGESVVIADVFGSPDEIVPYQQLARFHEVRLRIFTRESSFGSIHRVPKTVLDSMSEDFVPHDELMKILNRCKCEFSSKDEIDGMRED